MWNASRVIGSYYLSRLTGKPYVAGLPMSISFEPTTACNLRCPECPSGLRSFSRPTGNLKQELFRKVIDEVKDYASYLTFYFQGEPYINPAFLDMVSYADKSGLYTATSTNAHFLTDANAEKTVRSGLKQLIISIDGTDQETYASYRKGGSLEKVLEGTKNILRWKRELKSASPHVVFQFLVVRPNEHQVEEVFKLAKQMGVNEVKLKTAQVYGHEDGNNLIPTIDKYSRYKHGTDGKWAIKNSLDNHCWKMWHSCVITWDGKVVPCCFDKDATHVLGDVSQKSLREVWLSSAYRNFRKTLLRSRSEIEICRNCSEGTKVWA